MRGHDKWGANEGIVESLNKALHFLCQKKLKKGHLLIGLMYIKLI